MADEKKYADWIQALIDAVRSGEKPEETAKGLEILMPWASTAIWLWQVLPGGVIGNVTVERISIKKAPRSPGKVMLIVQGMQKKRKVVAFHTFDATAGLFDSFRQKAANDEVKWREDKPFEVDADGGETVPLPAVPGL